MKLGAVFEGGASRAYFSAGVMDALLDEKVYADYCIGVSAGIANGVSYASRQKGRNFEVGTKYLPDKRYMGVKYFLKKENKSLYNIDFVFREVPERCVPFDFKAYEKFGSETFVGLTDMETGKEVYMPALSRDGSWTNVVATCALPFLFQPVNIEGRLYMDGGIADPVPYKKAFEDGCDKVIVVLTRERSYVKKSGTSTRLAAKRYEKKYPAFAKAIRERADLYNREYSELWELEKCGKAYVVSPETTAEWKRTEKNPNAIKQMYDMGYNAVKLNKEELEKFLKR